ncbi:MAG: hypothetical protein ABI576_09795 [Flavobacterium sp.]
MKQLFYLLLPFLILISCKNSNQIKEIEILTYFNNARDFKIYSNTDNAGFTQTLYKSEASENVDNYQTRIRKSIMDSIMNVCKNATDDNFIFKESKNMWYCGNWHSVKVTLENGEKLIFKYPYVNKQNKQFIAFQSLSNQIRNDSLHATRLNIGQLGALYIK